MTITLKLGWKPIAIQPILSKGQDWIVTIKPQPGQASPVWPVGTMVSAVIYPGDTDKSKPLETWTVLYTWAADIDGDDLYFKGPQEDSDEIETGAWMYIRVSYPNTPTTDDYTYAKGRVTRDD